MDGAPESSKYKFVSKIGDGAFGKAFLVQDKHQKKQCVLKQISVSGMPEKTKKYVQQEAEILRKLMHQHVVRYIDFFQECGCFHLVMEYCCKGDLECYIKEQKEKTPLAELNRGFSENEVLNFLAQLCQALKYIHDQRIIHRDVKPANIFLSEGQTVKLGDFGVSKIQEFTEQFAQTHTGTIHYMSPQLLSRCTPYNNKTDIWSLGCVLYELMTFNRAFRGKNRQEIEDRIKSATFRPVSNFYSQELRDIMEFLLKRNANDRPSADCLLKSRIIRSKIVKESHSTKNYQRLDSTVNNASSTGNTQSASPANRSESQESRRSSAPISERKSVSLPAKSGAPITVKKSNSSGPIRCQKLDVEVTRESMKKVIHLEKKLESSANMEITTTIDENYMAEKNDMRVNSDDFLTRNNELDIQVPEIHNGNCLIVEDLEDSTLTTITQTTQESVLSTTTVQSTTYHMSQLGRQYQDQLSVADVDSGISSILGDAWDSTPPQTTQGDGVKVMFSKRDALKSDLVRILGSDRLEAALNVAKENCNASIDPECREQRKLLHVFLGNDGHSDSVLELLDYEEACKILQSVNTNTDTV